MSSFVKLEQNGHVATVTIDRPEKKNALSSEVLADLGNAIEELGALKNIRAALLTGSGKAFVAGAEIAGMRDLNAEEGARFADAGHRVFAAIEALPMPVIAAVNGFALGGGLELALSCDFIFASTKAKMGQPEVGLDRVHLKLICCDLFSKPLAVLLALEIALLFLRVPALRPTPNPASRKLSLR